MRKIKFQEIEFRNFLSYGNTWQKFKFSNGLNIIQGSIVESDKSNGSGKSSLTELVPFALFGKTIKKIKKAEITNWYNGKNCEVRLKFTVDGTSYEIRRGIKPNKLELYVNGDKVNQLASVVDFQSTVIEEEVIGMDFGTFKNLIYFSPNNTISIINAGKPEKRKFLESLFDLSIYSKMGKTVNEKLSSNDKKVSLRTQENESLRTHIETLQDVLDKQVMPDVRKSKIKLSGLVIQYDALKEKTFDVDDILLRMYDGTLQKCKDTLEEYSNKLKEGGDKVKLNQTLINNFGDTDELSKKRESIELEISEIEIVDVSGIEERIGDDTQHKELLKEEMKELINTIQGVEKGKAITISFITNIDKDIDKEESRDTSEGVCDSCGQDITTKVIQEQIDNNVNLLNIDKERYKKELTKIEKELEGLNEKKERLYEEIKDESSSIKTLMAQVEESKQAKDKQQRLQERLKDLPDIKEIEGKIEEYKEIIDSESSNQAELMAKIHLAEIDLEIYQTKLDKLKQIDEDRKKCLKDIETFEWQIKEVHDTIEEYQKIIETQDKDSKQKKQDIKDTEKKIEDNSKSIISANNITDYLNYQKTSLKDENVKRFAISSLIPYLNQQTNHYLSESGFPYVVTVDSWLDVNIRGLGVSDVSYGSLSGGEMKCIDMSVQLACNDIASMMAKTSLDIMVLDEVLDSSVDSLGVHALLNIIRVRQNTNNDSVYVITHRNELDGFIFDSVVRIIQEDKFSRIEVE